MFVNRSLLYPAVPKLVLTGGPSIMKESLCCCLWLSESKIPDCIPPLEDGLLSKGVEASIRRKRKWRLRGLARV